MATMDYSEMFKGGDNLTIDDVYQDHEDDEGAVSTAITTRNIDSALVEIGDESLWTFNQIEALGLGCPKSELSSELITIFASLFREVWSF
jgi:hypothetical protein